MVEFLGWWNKRSLNRYTVYILFFFRKKWGVVHQDEKKGISHKANSWLCVRKFRVCRCRSLMVAWAIKESVPFE